MLWLVLAAGAGMWACAPAHAQVPPEYFTPQSPQAQQFLLRRLSAAAGYSLLKDQSSSASSWASSIARVEARIAAQTQQIRRLTKDGQKANALTRAAIAERDAARIELMNLQEAFSLEKMVAGYEKDLLRAELGNIVVAGSPEKLAALEQFADGDRLGAMQILDEIFEAEKRVKKAAAAAATEHQARLSDIMLVRGERQSPMVLKLWEEVAQLTPDNMGAWLRIGELRLAVGDTPGAEAAYRILADRGTASQKQSALLQLINIEISRRDGGRYTDREIALTAEFMNFIEVPFDAEEMRGGRAEYDDVKMLGDIADRATRERPSDQDSSAWEAYITARIAGAWAALQQDRFDDAALALDAADDDYAKHGVAITSAKARMRLEMLSASLRGQLQHATGQSKQAEITLARALELAEAFRRYDPNNVQAGDGSILSKLADVQATNGRPALALTSYEEAVRGMHRSAAADPKSVVATGSVREVLDRYLLVCVSEVAFERCDHFLQEMAAIARKVPTLDDPERALDLTGYISTFLTGRVALLVRHKRFAEAELVLASIESLMAPFVSGYGSSRELVGSQAWVSATRGVIARDRADRTTAIQQFSKSFDAYKSLGEVHSDGRTIFDNLHLLAITNVIVEIAKLTDLPADWYEAMQFYDAAVAAGVVDTSATDATIRTRIEEVRRSAGS